MKTIIGDLWEQPGIKVIPTNLSVNKDGLAVMGRGVAKQAADKYPHLREEYGAFLKAQARAIQTLATVDTLYFLPPIKLILLPVKFAWREVAALSLIDRGCVSLQKLHSSQIDKVALPLLGCGFGELDEWQVFPRLQKYLDDRFTLVLRDESTLRRYEKTFQPSVRIDRSKVYG